ncbi:endophilin-B1 isoform X2 [Exaiptasia diaphana]|uniref:SH3 domain-containing GRB2-like protein B1 n=1 Tax=Exaiptasia diaphana TaxID=2652724 RepID=A0A913WQ44_EXADI|nr:endophilin-B1 isoform X2 [Exaiptasia diaphana]KXJ18872.1 Endophilin-B1 [Exaiptasia diaphana]
MSISKNHFSSFTMADFSDSMKKFGAASSTFFNRAKQYTEEQFGKSEATVLDARFMSLNEKADRTKCRTEQLLRQTETLLQPNIGYRAEEYLLDKLEKKKPERNTNLQTLGQFMRDAGHEFGPGTSYGSALIKVGTTEQMLGASEKEFMKKTDSHFLHPLRSFLEGDMKTIAAERRTLFAKRLDLDSCKAKVKKAQSPEKMQQAEQELRVAQAEFDRQYEVTKLLLDGINTAHASHHRALLSFVEAQAQYYAQCHQYMQDLQRQLGSPPGDIMPPVAAPTAPPSAGKDMSGLPKPAQTRKAKVLYDYDAADDSELSLLSDEILTVYSLPGMDNDWMMGERGQQRGRVPVTYLELID